MGDDPENLGTALARLGERESGTGRLKEAVAACREALKEADARASAARLGENPEQPWRRACAARRAERAGRRAWKRRLPPTTKR